MRTIGLSYQNGVPLHNVHVYDYLGIIFDSYMSSSPLFAKLKKIVSSKI